jgi:hypothetical protein
VGGASRVAVSLSDARLLVSEFSLPVAQIREFSLLIRTFSAQISEWDAGVSTRALVAGRAESDADRKPSANGGLASATAQCASGSAHFLGNFPL